MKKVFTKEVQIALIAIAALVILFFGMKFLKGLTMFSTDDNYYVAFSDVSGMSVSSPIYSNGYKVGVVERIDYDYTQPDRIMAVIGLDKKLRLPEGTVAEIASDLLGNVELQLKMGPSGGRLLAPGDTISGGMQQGAMSKAANMLPQIESMLPKLDSILASVNQLLADPALASSLHNVENITASLTATSTQLHGLTAELNRQMPALMQSANSTLTNTSQLTGKLADIDVAATMSKVDQTLQNVDQLTSRMNSTNGTLGLLINDTRLYNSLNSTVGSADTLLNDLKTHPKRYVHFSVFSGKDK